MDQAVNKDPLIGTTIDGRFFIEDILGTGGMSVVYKARQLRVNRYVAIKTIRLQVDTHSTVRERFLREVDTLCALSHPNIVSVFDCIFGPDDQPYIVMDLLRGKSLENLLHEEGPLTLNRFARIAVQVMSALEHAHKKGVIHRDLKPGNIMLIDNEDDFVKVVDFGLAKLEEAGRKLTRAGEIWGSPPYMSPEQAMSEPSDARSDIYSLAAVMYEMLTGKDPFFEATSVYELIQAHVQQKPPPFAHANPNVFVPIKVEQSILKALEKKPDNRYQSVGQLQSDLIGGLSGQLDRTGSEYILHFGGSIVGSQSGSQIPNAPSAETGDISTGNQQSRWARGASPSAGNTRQQTTDPISETANPADPELSPSSLNQMDELWKRKAAGLPANPQAETATRLRERQLQAHSRYHWVPWALAGCSLTFAVCMGFLILRANNAGKPTAPNTVQTSTSGGGQTSAQGEGTGSTGSGTGETVAKTDANNPAHTANPGLKSEAVHKPSHGEGHSSAEASKPHHKPHVAHKPANLPGSKEAEPKPKHHKDHPAASSGKSGGDPWSTLMKMRKDGN